MALASLSTTLYQNNAYWWRDVKASSPLILHLYDPLIFEAVILFVDHDFEFSICIKNGHDLWEDANSKIYSRLTNGSTWYSLKMTIFQNWFRLLIQILNTWNKFVFNNIVQNCGVGGERRRVNGDIVEKIEGTNDNMQMELMHLTPLCSLCHQATLAPRTFLFHLLTLLF